MDKLIKTKESELKRLKLISSYKKKEEVLMQKLKKIKSLSKSKVSKRSNRNNSTNSINKNNSKLNISKGLILRNGILYTGAGLASLLAIYRIYKIFTEPPVKPSSEIQMDEVQN